MNIQPQDIDALIEIFEASDWDELHLKVEGFELFLSTDPKGRAPAAVAPSMVAQAPATVAHAPAATLPAASAGESDAKIARGGDVWTGGI